MNDDRKMDSFIELNNRWKDINILIKQLSIEISKSIREYDKVFGSEAKKVLILGRNKAQLLCGLVEEGTDLVEQPEDVMGISGVHGKCYTLWSLPVHVVIEDDVVMIAGEVGIAVDTTSIGSGMSVLQKELNKKDYSGFKKADNIVGV